MDIEILASYNGEMMELLLLSLLHFVAVLVYASTAICGAENIARIDCVLPCWNRLK